MKKPSKPKIQFIDPAPEPGWLKDELNNKIEWRPITNNAYDGSTLSHTFTDPADWRGFETKQLMTTQEIKEKYGN